MDLSELISIYYPTTLLIEEIIGNEPWDPLSRDLLKSAELKLE